MIGCIIVLAVIVGLIAACICGCGKANGRSGNVISPRPWQGTYVIRPCTYNFRCGKANGRSENVINPQPWQGTYVIRPCTYNLGAARVIEALKTL